MSDAVLEARGVTRQYAGTRALDGVDFVISRAQVAALVGENGAGKSTLVKILGGIETASSGTVLMDGEPVLFRSVRDAEARGIAVIHQELNLCPNLSVADNIFLAREQTTAARVVDWRAHERRTRELLDRLEHPIDPRALVGDLPLGQQQIVEIARALSRDVRVLMMDEPTSALSVAETGVLFRIIRELTSRGVAVVYISHRLAELLDVSDTVSVLRDGRMVARARARDITAAWIVAQMTGRTEQPEATATGAPSQDAPSRPGGNARARLRLDSLSVIDGRGRHVLRDVSLRVSPGEVLGLYGLLGAGLTPLLETIIGVRRQSAGTILLDDEALDSLSAPERIARGLALVPEDRQAAGLVPTLSVRGNMSLSALGRFVRGAWLSAQRERAATSDMAGALAIRAFGLDDNIQTLSGGNQQKAIIGRALLTSPKVLLLDEPTRGVDIGAKREIHALVQRLASAGMAVVLASSDTHDIRSMAQRVIVLSRGVVTGEFTCEQATDEALAAAAGAALTTGPEA